MTQPPPSRSSIQDKDGTVDPSWIEFFSSVFTDLVCLQSSGTTAKRPTKNLFPGRFYFDTSLGANGKPIWVNKASTGWVLADGTAA
jgi:hypothetical protein